MADAGAALDHILALGGVAHEPLADVGGCIRVASAVDPFGNLLSAIENPHFQREAVP